MADAVVIGAGSNGLVAANHLMDAGWSVTVLEATSEPGGSVRTGELTLPGFHHDLFSAFYPLAVASPVIDQLDLEVHGLQWRRAPVALAHPLQDGRCAALSMDVDATAASLATFAPGDGDAWRSMFDGWNDVSTQLLGSIFGSFPPIAPVARLGLQLGMIGSLRFARHAILPVRRMAEELFDGEGGGLLLGGNALHADLSPEGAGSGLYGWLLSCLAQQHGFPVPKGGAGALTAALVKRLTAGGGTLLCDMRVTEVVLRRGRAVAVRTATGQTFDARRAVLADVAAPVLYRDLVGYEHLPAGVVDDLGRFQWDMSTVKVDWALDGSIPWAADDARRAGTVHVADDFDNLTEFTAQVAMGQLPSRPFLIVGQQSLADPSRSPAGTDTAWAYTHVPRDVRADAAGQLHAHGQHSDWLTGFVERMEARIEVLAPGFGSLIKARHVFSPWSMEETDRNLDAGAINGGTAQLHQQLVFRPVPGAGRPETPIANLYLASAGAHPGGGVHGGAGANAARAALLPAARARSVVVGRGSLRRQHR